MNTIIDSDILLVLEAGRVLEMGHPHELLNTPKGRWTGRREGERGRKERLRLGQIAEQAKLLEQVLSCIYNTH